MNKLLTLALLCWVYPIFANTSDAVPRSHFAPHLDLKTEIVRKFPTVAIEGDKIMSRQGIHAENGSDFHNLVYFLYLLDKHDDINALVRKFSRQEGYAAYTVDYLDLIYLLPAMLNERLGYYHSANADYHHYFRNLRSLPATDRSFTSRLHSLKLSLTRIKMMMLNDGWRPPTHTYHRNSYFNSQLDGLFSRYTKNRGYLAKYVKAGLFDHRPSKVDVMQEFDKIELAENPYLHYEACTTLLYRQGIYFSNSNFLSISKLCDLDALVSTTSSTHPVYWLAKFVSGRVAYDNGFNELARQRFSDIRSAGIPEVQFLKDDAVYFEALTWVTDDKAQSIRLLESLQADFDAASFDAIPAAADLLDQIQ